MTYYTRTDATWRTGMTSNLERLWNELVELAETPQKPAPGKITVELRGHPVHMLLAERGKVQTWKISDDSFESLRLLAGEYPAVPQNKQWLSMTDFSKKPVIIALDKIKPLWESLSAVAAPQISPEHYEATIPFGGREVRVAMFKSPSPTLYVHKDSVENVLRLHAEQKAEPDKKVESIVHKGMQALEQRTLPGRR